MEKELVEERKKLCNCSFFSRVIGYTHGWVNMAENGKVGVSDRFIEDYKEGLKKVREIIKK